MSFNSIRECGVTQRAEQKSATQDKIAAAALKQFAAAGLLGARTLDIAREAGVAHGSVFSHFSTREDLLVYVIRRFGDELTQRLHALTKAGKGVRAVLSGHLQGLREYEAFYSRLIMERPLLPTEATLALAMIQSAVSVHLFEAVQQDLKRRRVRRLPAHLLFNTWLGLIHYYLSQRDFFAPRGSVLSKYGQELLDHYMGLLSPGKR
jgi:AcrR family transcriptional regulator